MKFFNKSNMTLSFKIVIVSLLVCIGIVLQIAESMLDVLIVPGGKIGLANISALVCLFILDGKTSVVVSLLRSFLGCLLYGGVMAMPYSVGGAVFSALLMWFLKQTVYPRLGMVGISVLGAFAHNTAQLAAASLIFGSIRLFSYLPVLTIIGTIGGVAVGFGAKIFCEKIGALEK